MKTPGHIIVSVIGSSVFYAITGSPAASLWFIIAGVLVDIDHYMEYIRERGFSLDFKKVYAACGNAHNDFKKLFLVFHSYEILIIIWFLAFLKRPDAVWLSVAASLTAHLLLDQIKNPVYPLTYFLFYRIVNGFRTEKLFTQTKEVTYAP